MNQTVYAHVNNNNNKNWKTGQNRFCPEARGRSGAGHWAGETDVQNVCE
jgi:hypothetical protein